MGGICSKDTWLGLSPQAGRRADGYVGASPLRLYTESMLDYEISPGEAATLLAGSEARLIDVREPWEFSTASIGGSVAMPMGDVPARAHQELDPEERLVVVCHHGMRSMNVAVWLRNQGFEQAQSLRGGIDAWSAEVDPAVPRY
jgi:rhodanese-related sulfurtransferase